jgi:hypothetical protein
MRRILHQIDHLRIYGKFVNEVLGGDTTRFENKIFPEQKYDDEINIEELSENVIGTYDCFYENTRQEKFKVENTFINEPEKMWYKFKEMEGIMVRDLFTKESIKGEIKNLKEENINNLKDLRQKNEMLENEFNNLYEKKEHELNKFREIEKRYNLQKNEFHEIIKDFYLYVYRNLNQKADNKNTYIKTDPSDCVKEIYDIICKKEIYIDKLMLNLNNYEKDEPIFFENIVNKRKKEVKQNKQFNLLKEKMNEKLKYVHNIDTGKSKLFIYSRKTEAPYHKPKKVVVEKIDEKLIEQIENEELLKYEGD